MPAVPWQGIEYPPSISKAFADAFVHYCGLARSWRPADKTGPGMSVRLLHHGLPLLFVCCLAPSLCEFQALAKPLLQSFLLSVQLHSLEHRIFFCVCKTQVHQSGLHSCIILLVQASRQQEPLHQGPLGPNHRQKGFDLVVAGGFQLQVCANLCLIFPIVGTLLRGVGKVLVLLWNLHGVCNTCFS